MYKRHSMAGAAILAITISQLYAAPVMAQAAQQTGAEDNARITDIVVTARKVSERVQDVPVAISAFSGQQLASRGIQDLPSIGAITPGLSLTQGTGSSTQLNVSIRGNSEVDTQLALDPAVGVYVDNVYLARSINLGVGLYDLARVEILKGPQGTLFGRNTTGGAMNITTADPEDKFGGYVKGTYGNYSKIGVQGAVTIPIADDLGLRLATNINKRDGFTRNALLNKDLEDEDTQSVRGKFLWKPEGWEIRLNGDYTHVNQASVSSVATPIEPCDPFAGVGVQAVFNPNCGTPANVAFITGLYGPGGPFAVAAGVPGGLLVPDGSGGMVLPPSLTNIAGAINGFVPGTINTVLAQNAATQNNPRRVYLNTNGVTVHTEYGGSLSIAHDLGDVNIKSITAYRRIKARDLFDSDGTSLPLLDVDKDLTQKQISQELQITGKVLDDALNFAAGYFFVRETGTDIVDQDVGGLTSVTTLATDAVNTSHALYAQASYDVPFLTGLRMSLGYRQSWDKRQVTVRHQALGKNGGGIPNCDLEDALITRYGSPGTCAATVSKKFPGHSLLAGLDYHVTKTVLLYSSYKQGFRSGGFSGRAGSLAQLQPVPPEKVYDIELGIKSDWFVGNMPVRLNVAGFQTQIHNRQREFTRLTPTGGLTTIVESAQRSSVKGVEVEATLIPVKYLNLNASLSYIDSKYKLFIDRLGVDHTDEPVPQAPKWHYTLGFGYSRPVSAGGIADLSVDYSWLGSQSFGFNPDPTVTAKSYGVVNARAGWENVLDKGFSVHAFAKNLTNERYVNGGVFLRSNFGYSINYYGAPRTYGVEVGFNF